MNTTVNLNLKKPEGTDSVNIADINSNMDILDQAVANKVDKVSGKQLSTEDYTTVEKNKLAGIAENANNYAHPATHSASIITEDSTHRFVTDAEKLDWNGKASQESLDEVSAGLADIAKYPTATGTGTAIAIAYTPFDYTARQSFTFIASTNNSGGAITIAVNGGSAINLYKPNTTDVPNIVSGKAYTVWYDGTSFFLKASAEGDAVAANVLAGKTFSNDDDTGIVGTMDLSSLISDNIRENINIDGIVGNVVEARNINLNRTTTNIDFLNATSYRGLSHTIVDNEKWAFSGNVNGLKRIKYNSNGTILENVILNNGYSDLSGEADVFEDSVALYNNSNTYRIFDLDGTLIMNATSGATNSAWYFGCNKYGDNLRSYYDRSDFYIHNSSGTIMLQVSYDFSDSNSDSKPFRFIDHELVLYANEKQFGYVYKSGGTWVHNKLVYNSSPNMTTYTDWHSFLSRLLNMMRLLKKKGSLLI